MARLLSNISVLRSGQRPVVIDVADRQRYIGALSEYQLAAGQLSGAAGVWPDQALAAPFEAFCHCACQSTLTLIEQARAQQTEPDALRRVDASE